MGWECARNLNFLKLSIFLESETSKIEDQGLNYLFKSVVQFYRKMFSFAMHFCDFTICFYLLEIFFLCVSEVEVFKEIIYFSQNKCFNIFIALKYPSTFIALKYSIYITPKGALKNVIIQGITFFL